MAPAMRHLRAAPCTLLEQMAPGAPTATPAPPPLSTRKPRATRFAGRFNRLSSSLPSPQVCVRREEGYCSIRHTTATSSSFSLSEKANAAATTGARGATDCYVDFITIPDGSLDGSSSGVASFDRYCGVFLGWTDDAATNQPIICKNPKI